MSKIKIVGHASGSGVLTIAAPNTNTDRTITIPDVTGTLLDSGSDLPAANLTGTIADARIPATLPAKSGVNLTALNASNIGSGTVPTARLGSGTANNGVFLRGDNTWAAAGSTSASDLTSGTLPIARIADDAVTNAKIADDAIDSAQIADGSVDDAHLATGITASKLTGALPAISGANLTGIAPATVATSAPGSPSAGDLWFDSTSGTSAMKVYNGTAWDIMSNKFSASGGTITTSGGYTIHTFTSSGAFVVEANGTVEYLVVAGGGGGGDEYYSGGGGAGGYRTATGFAVTAQTYSITVGAGGAGGGSSGNGSAGQGSNSVFSTITSTGGGKGGNGWAVGTAGGSGGGGGGSGNENRAGGAGTSGQGYAGGQSCCNYRGGGGGGAGGAGTSSSSSGPSPGGDAATSSISGTSTSYAAGGGGNCHSCSNGMGSKKDGIGGATTHSPTYTQNLSLMDGTANTGSGGSGGDKRASGFSRMGNGGSGIVIIRYLTP